MLQERHFTLHIIQNAKRNSVFYIPCMVSHALASSWLFWIEIAIAKADETLGTSWNISSH